MSEQRRSPYLILGIDFGTSKQGAAKAFARATRRLRRLPDPPYDIEDLNWALHAVEQRVDDPGTSIDDFRMPADPAAYLVPDAEGGVLAVPEGDPTPATFKASLIRCVLAARANKELEGAPLPALHRFDEEDS